MNLPAFLDRLRPRSRRGKRIAAGAAILAGATLTSVSIFATGPNPEPEAVTEKAWPVSVVEAWPQATSPMFTAYGRVESNRVARMGSDLSARVAAVHVREGDWVAAGDLLIELDAAEAGLQLAEREADLAQAEAQLASIEAEVAVLERTLEQARSMHRIAQDKLNRHQELANARLISQSVLDEVVAQANRATIDLEDHERRVADLPNRLAAQRALVKKTRALTDRARLDLDKTRITAPFAGPVLAVRVAPGDRSSLGVDLVELADAAGFEVRVELPSVYEARFQRHLDAGDSVAAVLGDGRRLELARLARRVRPGQSGVDAFFRLGGTEDGRLPAIGRVVDMRVSMPEEQGVVALPIASLYENDRVYAVEASRLQAIRVERVGELHTAEGEYRVLVRAPELVDGRRVITTQLPKAVPGLLVETS